MGPTAIGRNTRVSPLRPDDTIDLTAAIQGAGGQTITAQAAQPVVDHSMSRFTRWWGVGMDARRHGRSGIGSSKVPATHAAVALDDITSNGQAIAIGVPIQSVTVPDGRAELDVGAPDAPSLPGTPDNHLRVMFAQSTLESHSSTIERYLCGSLSLVLALVLAVAGLRH